MPGDILVFDSSPLSHFARAGELATLRDLVSEFECVTTKAVLGELRKGVAKHPAIQEVIDLGSITEPTTLVIQPNGKLRQSVRGSSLTSASVSDLSSIAGKISRGRPSAPSVPQWTHPWCHRKIWSTAEVI
jgi:hypothetical protein